MNTLIQAIHQAQLSERIITERQMARLLDGTPQRRYNLVNRALRSGELVRLKRGRYLLSSAIQTQKIDPFVVVQALQPGAYVSFETALQFHGWIPEATYVTMAVTPTVRQQKLSIPLFGQFHFYPLALHKCYFLEAVDRHLFSGQSTFVAQPLRALLDLIYLRKLEAATIHNFITEMRLDALEFNRITVAQCEQLMPLYKHTRMAECITALQKMINND